ncbi:hypothetical protein JXM83_04835 [Candidatus Woesearchaeota archaeon]|nr:hypothetical protein [Candidatus Woesearchaeota archaeon]
MKQIETKDNSLTFYNEEVDETYHSTSGAIEESFKKFAIPACDTLNKVKSILKMESISILDMYYGLGYNTLAIIYYLKESLKYTGEIKVVAIEKDPNIIEVAKGIKLDVKEYPLLDEYYDKLKQNKFNVTFFVTDAYDALEKIHSRFDIVMYDSFSPAKKPELWTPEIFRLIKKLCEEYCVLTTYSCARVVKDSLKEAGFYRYDGPKVGRRSPATIATTFEITT